MSGQELTIEQMKAAVLDNFPSAFAYSFPEGYWAILPKSGITRLDRIGAGNNSDAAWRDAWQKHCASPKSGEGERETSDRDERRFDQFIGDLIFIQESMPLEWSVRDSHTGETIGWSDKDRSEAVRSAMMTVLERYAHRPQPTAQPDEDKVSDKRLYELISEQFWLASSYVPTERSVMARELLQLRSKSHLSAEDVFAEAEKIANSAVLAACKQRWLIDGKMPEVILRDLKLKPATVYERIEADRKAGPR